MQSELLIIKNLSALKTDISAVSVMDELLLIELFDHTLSQQIVEYQILNHNQQIQRKGSFRGPSVQMRISSLPAGRYELHLLTKNGCIATHDLVRKVPNFIQTTETAFYRSKSFSFSAA